MNTITTPDGKKVQLEILSKKEGLKLIKSANQTIKNTYDIERRKLYKLEDGSVLHRFTDDKFHLYSNLEEYLKLYNNDFIKEVYIRQIGENVFYSFDIYLVKIDEIMDKIDFSKPFENPKVYKFENVYFLNNDSVILVNDKKNRLNWYPNKESFNAFYKITYYGLNMD